MTRTSIESLIKQSCHVNILDKTFHQPGLKNISKQETNSWEETYQCRCQKCQRIAWSGYHTI